VATSNLNRSQYRTNPPNTRGHYRLPYPSKDRRSSTKNSRRNKKIDSNLIVNKNGFLQVLHKIPEIFHYKKCKT